jgi:hypothetical protein
MDLGETPYPELTRGFLSAVPLVLTIWPMLLMGVYAFRNKEDDGSQTGRNEHDHVEP